MFKKKCNNCNNKIEKSYEFCPFCGQNLKSKTSQEDYGILGVNDSENFTPESLLGGSVIDKLFKTAMNMVEKQMKNMQQEGNPQKINQNQNQNPFGKNVRVQFSINGKKVDLPNLMPPQNQQTPKQTLIQPEKRPQQIISKEKAEKFKKLPKQEAKSKVRRFSGKLIYELEIPGVKNINNILINQLENSIEIKALAPTKVYTKTININLPLLRYRLNQGNLILELQAK